MSEPITWTNERRKLSELVPWERNPRQIRKDEARRLEDSLERFGQIQTIAIGPDNEVYDGHQRKLVWAASQKFGPDYEVDVRVSSRALTEREREQLVVYLHRGTVGEWDWDLLATLDVPDLLDWGFTDAELGLAGFDLGGNEPPPDPGAQIDKAAELQEKWGVKTGDVWELGEHRVACGDCTDPAVVEAVMRGERADAVVTDPPYGVKKASWDGSFPPTDVWYLIKNQCKKGANVIIFPGEVDLPPKINVLCSVFDYQWPIIWYKPNAMQFGATGYTVQSIAWWLSVELPVNRPKMRDVIVDPMNPKENDFGHPTPKNINVLGELVGGFSVGGGIVYDPFLGSGTTLIACERLGRRCRGIEIHPPYVAVTLQRWADLTGRAPSLAAG